MAKNKEVELQKYLEKKRRQKSRDEIMNKIAELSRNRTNNGISLIKKKIKMKRVKEDESFEKKLFLHESSDANEESSFLDEKTGIYELYDYNGLVSDVKHNEIPDENVSCPFVAEVLEESKSYNEKQSILNLNESFRLSRLTNRLEKIQNQRKEFDIMYEETEIVSQIKYNLITFVQGETGCGKTTQVSQFLYENGFATDKMIVLTQPRRFSAISISNRINYEANEDISGYKIKYENNIKAHTKIKVVTEGVLFREIQLDFLLKQYSVVILDEVHERSTNMDILIGLLSRIVKIRFAQKNPLRLVLMSATTNPEHFRPVLTNFQLINLTGKRFPVNVFFESKIPEDYIDCAYKKILAILQAEQKYSSNKKSKSGEINVPAEIENTYKASVLVFLTSKEDIYTLKSRLDAFNEQIIVLPLHSGLSKSDQDRVYETFPVRKIVLATNIAETSVTINDIVFVIDCGLEKRKIADENVVMYRTSFICKSSAKQRMGRAGRTGPGICYRLYSGDAFEMFSDHSFPQILMEPFDASLLQLKNMGIKNIFGFPFIDQPSEIAIEDSVRFLESLGALDQNGNITKLGRKMCSYPIKPRYARFLVVNFNVLPKLFSKLVVIVSILSCGFELKRNESTKGYFTGAKSDLIVFLKLYIEYLKTKNKKLLISKVGISADKFEEIRKMASYLLQIAKVDIDFDTDFELTCEDEKEICCCLYYLFADQLAINTGSLYIFNDDEFYISHDSIETEQQNIVFDYIVCGSRRSYVKNITVVPSSLFK
ncbi:uncharacterized protein VICG_00048 [Vittaforma corneae ATCC 50505]|uniref:RNA helicase n=1 Tax=Vittaforma corneae (strain ATCC 50505) TaxID=993615 RepID=L2GPB9_VITCO|nr:uncharacterized protein VICG_00048 [Vittaforma corneae ATCC 50505]ELA42733.1 hypothetical protein VICG_00048 [Vittaforma corneae ATCC 50505]